VEKKKQEKRRRRIKNLSRSSSRKMDRKRRERGKLREPSARNPDFLLLQRFSGTTTRKPQSW
jgi:hypothetical protein